MTRTMSILQKTFPHLLFVFLIIILPTVGKANDLNLASFGAVADDGQDDAPALQAALNQLAAIGGGRLIFPPGQTDILTPVAKDYLNQASSITLTGLVSGSRVRIAVGANQIGIKLTNVESVLIEKLVFHGSLAYVTQDPLFFDAYYAIQTGSCLRVTIRDCDFYGLATSEFVMASFSGDLHVEDSAFRGCHGQAVLASYDWSGLTVRRVDFTDYGVLNGVYHSKSPAFPGAWIYTAAPKPLNNANGERRVVIEDVRLDEGAANGVLIDGASFVSVKGVTCNVNGTDNGAGIWLNNVRRAKIEQSFFGYTTQDRPGVKLSASDIIELDSVEFGQGVRYVWTLGNVSWLILRHCKIPQSSAYPQGVKNEGGTRIEVIDTNPVSVVQFAAANFSALEKTKSATITLVRSGDTYGAITIDCVTANGTATSPADYQGTLKALRFAAGETQITFDIRLEDDNIFEGTETIQLVIRNPTDSAILGGQTTATVNIEDDEPPPAVLILLTEAESPERAIALDSVTLMRGPSTVLTSRSLGPDLRTRVMLFASGVESSAGDSPISIMAQAEDSQHRIYPLAVEFVGKVPGAEAITQINVRLADELTSAGDVWVSISVGGVMSNKALIAIGQ